MTSPRIDTIRYSKRDPDLTLFHISPTSLGSEEPTPAAGNNATDAKLIFYIHGGGFVTGDAYCVPPHLYGLSKLLGAHFISVNYRLCPEAGIKTGCIDVQDAWKYVVQENKIDGIHFTAKKTIVVGMSAGGFFGLRLLLSDIPEQPAGFFNLYGATHIDSVRNSKPRPQSADTPLDQPGGFPPLTALLKHLYEPVEAGASDEDILSGKVKLALRAGLPSTSEVRISLLDEILAHKALPSEDVFKQLWQANGLSAPLYEATNAGAHMSLDDAARGVILIWALRTGNFMNLLRGERDEDAEAKVEDLDWFVEAFGDLRKATKPIAPVLSIHGDQDDLVSVTVSQDLDEILKSKGWESEMVVAAGQPHGFDAPQWIIGSDSNTEVKALVGWAKRVLKA